MGCDCLFGPSSYSSPPRLGASNLLHLCALRLHPHPGSILSLHRPVSICRYSRRVLSHHLETPSQLERLTEYSRVALAGSPAIKCILAMRVECDLDAARIARPLMNTPPW